MKKLVSALLSITLLLSMTSMLAASADDAEKLELTVYYGTMREMMEPVISGFTEKYPNVTVKEFRATTEELAATVQMELMANNPQFDVLIIGDTTLAAVQDAFPDAYQPFVTESQASIIPGLLDPENCMIPIGMGFYTIAYNTNLVTADEAPKQWKDLLDEKWNNVMAMADPQTSSAVYGFIWYIIEHQKYGWEYFDQLDALNITYIGSHGTIAEMVNIGERSVAVLTMANVIKCVNEGNPVGHNVPLDGSPTELVSGAICAGTPNQEAAELFMNYLVTVEGQELVNSYLGYIPVRNDMDFSFPDGSTLEGLDLYSRDVQWINENKEDIIDRFSVLFAN